MAISETQLETWAHQGAITTSKDTADSIRNALKSYDKWPEGVKFEIYLQGSYKNDTNIRGNSDVDVVAQLDSTFYNNLSEEQKHILGFSVTAYGYKEFRNDVLAALRKYYGSSSVTEGEKTLKVLSSGGRLPADVVVCSQYREYKTVSHSNYVEGMCFWATNQRIINFPKFHYENGVLKHQASSEWFKPIIRLFKNIRDQIPGAQAPSYFIECLLYNVPNSQFGNNYQTSFCNIVNWLRRVDLSDFETQSQRGKLFGTDIKQWDKNQAQQFVQTLISFWNS